jgi:hypothetical protein
MSKCPLEELTKIYNNLIKNNEKNIKELETIIKEDDALVTEYNIIEEEIDDIKENNNNMEDDIQNLENMIYIAKNIKHKKNNNNTLRNYKKLMDNLATIKAKNINTNSELNTQCDIIIEKIINAYNEINNTPYNIEGFKADIKKFKLFIGNMNTKKYIVEKKSKKLLAKVNMLKAKYKALQLKLEKSNK